MRFCARSWRGGLLIVFVIKRDRLCQLPRLRHAAGNDGRSTAAVLRRRSVHAGASLIFSACTRSSYYLAAEYYGSFGRQFPHRPCRSSPQPSRARPHMGNLSGVYLWATANQRPALLHGGARAGHARTRTTQTISPRAALTRLGRSSGEQTRPGWPHLLLRAGRLHRLRRRPLNFCCAAGADHPGEPGGEGGGADEA